MTTLFLSHASEDAARARELARRLEATGRCTAWMSTSIEVGQNYAREIYRHIKECDAMLVLLSPSSLDSEHVRREVGLAVDAGKPLLPVTLDPGLLDSPDLPDDWRYWLHTTQAVAWSDARTVTLRLTKVIEQGFEEGRSRMRESVHAWNPSGAGDPRAPIAPPAAVSPTELDEPVRALPRASDPGKTEPTSHTLTAAKIDQDVTSPSTLKRSPRPRLVLAGAGMVVVAGALSMLLANGPFADGSKKAGVPSASATASASVQGTATPSPTVADSISYRVITTIQVGDGPWGVAADSSVGVAYVTNFRDGSVSFINTENLVLQVRFLVGPTPTGVVIDPTRGRMYNANWKEGRVTSRGLMLESEELLHSDQGAEIERIAVDSVTGRILVPSSYRGTVLFIDPESGEVTESGSVGQGPSWVTIDARSRRAYALSTDGTVTALDSRSGEVVAQISLGAGVLSDIAIDPQAKLLYVARTNGVTVLDPSDLTVVGEVPFASQPKAVAVDPGLDRAYVTLDSDNQVAVVRGSTREVVSTFSTDGLSPTGVAVDLESHRVWVANRDSNTVSVIEALSGEAR